MSLHKVYNLHNNIAQIQQKTKMANIVSLIFTFNIKKYKTIY